MPIFQNQIINKLIIYLEKLNSIEILYYTIYTYKIDQSTCSFSPILPQKIIP